MCSTTFQLVVDGTSPASTIILKKHIPCLVHVKPQRKNIYNEKRKKGNIKLKKIYMLTIQPLYVPSSVQFSSN